jgi:hypothetical protein
MRWPRDAPERQTTPDGTPMKSLAYLAVALVPLTSSAVDGVFLIDQNRALAGSVTPGDTPGFPIVISQPGSYRLSGSLTVPAAVNAIMITVPNVTLDLNGFAIVTTPVTPPASSYGIFSRTAGAASNIVVRNGTITGFTVAFSVFGPSECRHCTLQDMVLDWAYPGSVTSIDLGSFSRVLNVSAPSYSVNVKCPSTVAYSAAYSISRTLSFPGDPVPGFGICSLVGNASTF